MEILLYLVEALSLALSREDATESLGGDFLLSCSHFRLISLHPLSLSLDLSLLLDHGPGEYPRPLSLDLSLERSILLEENGSLRSGGGGGGRNLLVFVLVLVAHSGSLGCAK